MYRVWCKFDKSLVNPLTGKIGRWRVTGCYIAMFDDAILRNYGSWNEIYKQYPAWPQLVSIGIKTGRPYRVGSYINPRKELLC